jgi:hypothetical protein
MTAGQKRHREAKLALNAEARIAFRPKGLGNPPAWYAPDTLTARAELLTMPACDPRRTDLMFEFDQLRQRDRLAKEGAIA